MDPGVPCPITLPDCSWIAYLGSDEKEDSMTWFKPLCFGVSLQWPNLPLDWHITLRIWAPALSLLVSLCLQGCMNSLLVEG